MLPVSEKHITIVGAGRSGVVGFIAMSIVLPIFKMSSLVKK